MVAELSFPTPSASVIEKRFQDLLVKRGAPHRYQPFPILCTEVQVFLANTVEAKLNATVRLQRESELNMLLLRKFCAKVRNLCSVNKPDLEFPAELIHRSTGSIQIRIVALIARERDRQLLSRLAADQNWVVHFAETCGGAWDLLKQHRAPLALCDRDFPGTEWRDVIQMMSSTPTLVYAILLSRVADDNLWNEVIRHGGYDLIATPLREEDTLRAIRLGWSYWSTSMRIPPMMVKHYL